MQGIRDLSPDERTAKMGEMRQATKDVSDKVAQILTPQQRETIEEGERQEAELRLLDAPARRRARRPRPRR